MSESNGAAPDLFEPWTAALGRGEIVIPRCTDCLEWDWYPRLLCAACGSTARQWVPVDAKGVIHTWTRVERAVDPVEGLDTPYIVALISLTAAPTVRVPALAHPALPAPAIGQEVDLSVRVGPGGPHLQFFPVNTDVDSHQERF